MIRTREEQSVQCACCGQSIRPTAFGPAELVHGLALCESCQSTGPASSGASRRKRARTESLGAPLPRPL